MSQPKFMKKLAILVAIEVTAGTIVVPVAAGAIEVSDVTLTPIEGDEVSSNVIKPFFGASETTLVTLYRKVAFSVPLAGVGALGTLPGYTTLMRACGASATNTPGSNTVFSPVTDDMETITIYAVIDKVLYKLSGARGNCKADASSKSVPKWQFEFTGSFYPAQDQGSMPAVSYTAFQKALGVNKANSTLSLAGYTAAASTFSLDFGNTVVKQDLMDVDSTEITGRASKGSVTFRHTSVATKDWITMAKDGAKVPLIFTHGPANTNTVQFNVPRAQLGKPTFGEQDGIQMITIPYTAIPSDTGNDEWTITV